MRIHRLVVALALLLSPLLPGNSGTKSVIANLRPEPPPLTLSAPEVETQVLMKAAAMREADHQNALRQLSELHTSISDSPLQQTITDTCASLPSALHPKILILTYNPWLTSVGKSLFAYESPFDPSVTSEQMRQDFCIASGGFVDIQIVGRVDRAEFPPEDDGKRMSETEYYQLRSQGLTYWDVHGARTDMKAVVEDGGLNLLVKTHQVDEIWLFGSWSYGGFEAYMGGPGAFFVNGPTFDTDSGRGFVVMYFENAVGVPNSLHSIGHRVEFTLYRAYGFDLNQDTPWLRFIKNPSFPVDRLPTAPLGVGDIHHPPNTSVDYDYTNQTVVQSAADDWLKYPNLTGQTKPINAEAWGNTDHGYYRWWYAHLPKADGVSSRSKESPDELRQNNWWKYIFDFNSYVELVGQPLFINPSVLGYGQVTVEPDKRLFLPTEVVTLTATPVPGWKFTSWSVFLLTSNTPITYTTNPLTLTMNVGAIVYPIFVPVPNWVFIPVVVKQSN